MSETSTPILAPSDPLPLANSPIIKGVNEFTPLVEHASTTHPSSAPVLGAILNLSTVCTKMHQNMDLPVRQAYACASGPARAHLEKDLVQKLASKNIPTSHAHPPLQFTGCTTPLGNLWLSYFSLHAGSIIGGIRPGSRATMRLIETPQLLLQLT